MNLKISVVTVCYNAADCIEKTILSVINQTYQDIEYIIIDGGSTDGTVDTIKKYTGNIAYWVSEPDNGIYDAMNKGIAKATGEWINFMNAGDCFVDNNILSNVFVNSNVSSDCNVIYGDTIGVTQYGMFYVYARPLKHILNSIMPLCHQSAFVRTNMMKQRPFNLSYRITADYDFFLYLYKNGFKFQYQQIPVAYYEKETGVSALNYIDAKIERAQILGNVSGYFQKMKFRIVIFLLKARFYIRQRICNSFPNLYKRLYMRKYGKYKYLS